MNFRKKLKHWFKYLLRKEHESVLVYGLAEDRYDFITSHTFEQSKRKQPLLIDFYNEEIIKNFSKESGFGAQGLNDRYKFFREVKKNSKTWLRKIQSKNKKWPLWKAYYKLTQQDNKFNFSTSCKNLEMIFPEPNDTHFSNVLANIVVKRGCKLGLELAKDESNLKILFILDRLNIDDVALKQGPYRDSITGSELRYIYRNRDLLEHKIFFIRNNEVVPAPWNEQKNVWLWYDHTRNSKKINDVIHYSKADSEKNNRTLPDRNLVRGFCIDKN